VAIDIGTGDGRAVLAAAARAPRTLVLGVDANAAAMAEASRRAAAPARRGGLANAAFIVAAAESPPPELAGIAAIVTVRFPWASLLRGCVGHDDAVADGVASLVGRGGTLELLLAPSPRDGLAGVPIEPAELARAATAAFAARGLDAVEARPATNVEIAASNSTWVKRLRSQRPSDRPVMLIRLVRPT
jgi:16S rRNA (adenine(1408)-N(1))-methyltransferase